MTEILNKNNNKYEYSFYAAHRYDHMLYNDAIDICFKENSNLDRLFLFS